MTLFWIVLAVTLLFLAGLTCFLCYYGLKEIEDIKKGYEDASLLCKAHEEAVPTKKKETSRKIRKIAGIVLDVVLVFLGLFFLLSLTDRLVNSFALPFETMVVATGSMSEKNEANAYLFEEDLNDQIQVDDLIGIKTVSSLDEIRLYDIVCYRNGEDIPIVHRVIEVHDTYLTMRGDANAASDSTRVTMENIVGVYTHFRIPKVGILVFFVQSDYGILAFAGILYILIFYDQYSKYLRRAEDRRLNEIRNIVTEEKDFDLVSTNGELHVKDGHYAFEGSTDYDGESYFLSEGRKVALPESEFSIWKTN